MTKPTIAALIVAAGSGTRAGGDIAKQWQSLLGKAVIDHTVSTFQTHEKVGQILLVINPNDAPLLDNTQSHQILWVSGGATRAASVYNGLCALNKGETPPDYVLIHDAARACVTHQVISDVIDALNDAPAAAPGMAVTDALWRVEAGSIKTPHPRDGLYRAQTPQGFHLSSILEAHQKAVTNTAADDVELALNAGIEVRLTAGHEDNIKITHKDDFARAERILNAWM